MTLGQVLKSKRLELGKSIEQIATATRIHVKVLKALEEDHYGELPARAFTRGFIIAYCKALHINPDEIMRDYHDFLESKYSERPEKDHGHHGYAFEGKEIEQNKRWMIIIASIAAFFAILTLLFFKPQNHKHKEKHKELIAEEAELAAANSTPAMNVDGNIGLPTQSASPTSTITTASTTPSASVAVSPTPATTPTSSATPSATPTATPSTTPSSTPTASPTPNASASPSPSATPQEDPLNKGDGMLPKDTGVKITLQALDDAMIHYHSDQRKPFSLMLRKDRQLVIKASEIIRVETNKPEHLKYKLNFKNKGNSPFTELKQERLELRPDGTQTTFDAGAL